MLAAKWRTGKDSSLRHARWGHGRGVGLRPGALGSLPSPRQSVVPLCATRAARPELSGTTKEHSFGQLSLHALLGIMRWELMEMILL